MGEEEEESNCFSVAPPEANLSPGLRTFVIQGGNSVILLLRKDQESPRIAGGVGDSGECCPRCHLP